MAKSESTAVNALIDMVRSGQPAAPAADDLFASPPLSNTIPPLPPMRAPTGTSQLDLKNGQVRMSTAPPSRANTIPPLPQARGTKAPPPPTRASSPAVAQRASQQMPAQRASQQMPAQRVSQPPPPVRASQPPPPVRASQQMRAPQPPVRTSQQMPAQARRTPQQLQAQQAYRGVGDDVPTGKLAPEPTTNKVTPPRRAASPSPDALVARKRAASPGPEALLGKKRTTGAQRTAPPSTTPIAAPFEAPHPMLAVAEQYRNSTIDQTGDAVSADNWFEASRAVEKIDETWVGTKQAPRRRDAADTVKRAVVPLVALAVVGFGVGYVVFHAATKKHATAAKPAITHVAAPAAEAIATPAAPSTESANAATATAGGSQPEPPAPTAAPHPNANEVKVVDHASDETPGAAAVAAPATAAAPVAVASAAPAPAPTAAAAAAAVAAPAPAPVPAAVPATAVKSVGESAPVVHEIQTAHGTVSLVDVRIDSTPAGATVMLVDNGKTTFLGTTPVAASVDPGRTYDVVLTLEGRPTQMTHLDPSKTQRLDVTLGKAAKAAPAVRTASAPRAETPRKVESSHKATRHVAASAPTGGLADPGFDTPAESKADAGGSGTLMVSSKPPCEIFIDGNDSGKKTPQRAMSLPAGVHKVTFSNTDENITKTVSVKITADQTTKLIQDLMPKP